MAKASSYTKKSKVALFLLRATSFLVLFGPLFVYTVIAFKAMQGTTTTRTITCISIMGIAAILGLFNILLQKKLRCVLWVLLLALMVVIDNLIPLTIMVGLGSILDDLVLTPLIEGAKARVISNKEMDKRLN